MQQTKQVNRSTYDELAGMYEAFAGRMELYTKITDAVAAPELPADDLKAKLQGYIAYAHQATAK
jgi:hypothetical protein